MQFLNIAGYIAIPLAFVIHFLLGAKSSHVVSWEPIATFVLAGIGVIPLARLMGEATEHLSDRVGPTWGGLLNATFGNAAELIISIIAMTRGLNEMVKASLTGSILGNLLLVGGGAMLVGGWNREKQTFNRDAAEAGGGLLLLAVAALLLPAIFHHAYRLSDPSLASHERGLSIGVSVILLVVYALGMLFTLKTHAHVLSPSHAKAADAEGSGDTWTVRRCIVLLVIAAIGIGIVAELLVGSAETIARRLGWNDIFVGVILLAVIGNAAEHSTALLLARRDDMDTALSITTQSSLQIALFVTPLLVLLSAVLVATSSTGVHQLDLLFSPLEVVAVLLGVVICAFLGLNGQSNWFEGALLIALYAILGIVFFYIPAGSPTP